MSEIFKPLTDLRPSQLLAVADRRFDDAVALSEANDNARANGVQYLAGLVIEISLKAQLVRRYPRLTNRDASKIQLADRITWNLIWRSHELTEMLEQMPDLIRTIDLIGVRAGRPYTQWLRNFCAAWTIYVRYSTKTSMMAEARSVLARVRELKEVLR